MRKAIPVLVATLLFGFTLTAVSFWPNAQKDAWDATFAVSADTGKGSDVICTATAYMKIPNGYYLLTAGHCIADSPDATFSVSEDVDSPRTEVRVVKYYVDNLMDFAVLQLLTNKSYPVIPLGDDAEVGDRILNPNFSYALAKQLSEGTVSSAQIGKIKGCDECEGKMLVQVYGSLGCSGSAVIENGHIVGIVSAYLEGINVGLVAEPISRYPSFLAAPEMKKGNYTLDFPTPF